MQKIINLENIKRKRTIKFFCTDNATDFSQRTTHILVYFDEFEFPEYDFYAEKLISDNNQPQTNVFDLDIPSRTNAATIVIITNRVGHTLDSIVAEAV